jgi:hypothetical protein
MTSLELILSKIPDTDQCRACGAAQNRNGSRAKISSPKTPPFLPARKKARRQFTVLIF